MKPIEFSEQNHVMGPPPGHEDTVMPLHVAAHPGGYVSAWQPSELDKERIAAGHPVYLEFFSPAHPPVWVSTQFPPHVHPYTPAQVQARTAPQHPVIVAAPGPAGNVAAAAAAAAIGASAPVVTITVNGQPATSPEQAATLKVNVANATAGPLSYPRNPPKTPGDNPKG